MTLLKTIPSGSHNASYSEADGYHWPAGTQFKVLPKYAQDRYKCLLMEQIGGEQVILSVPLTRLEELFGAQASRPPKTRSQSAA
jgi:hypothetical protein